MAFGDPMCRGFEFSESDDEIALDEHNDNPKLLRYMIKNCQREIISLREELKRMQATIDVDLNGGQLPTRTHRGDAGFDLYVTRTTALEPGEFVDIPCSVRVQLPLNMWGFIIGRSSTLRTRGLLVNFGVIDQGYHGELFAGAWNLRDERAVVWNGERVAQFIPMSLLSETVVLREVEKLGHSERGQNGFGSSGT